MSMPVKKIAPALQTGADLLVKSLEAQGVEYVFGIPGAKIDKVFDRLVDSRIQTVVCRHEQNAAFAVKTADYVHVMSRGRIVHSSEPAALWANQAIKTQFLGVPSARASARPD